MYINVRIVQYRWFTWFKECSYKGPCVTKQYLPLTDLMWHRNKQRNRCIHQ